MPAQVDVQIANLRTEQKWAEEQITRLFGQDVLQSFREATMLVAGEAKKRAKTNEGRWRASITPEVEMVGNSGVRGIVGSNLKHAPFADLDCRPHWPPKGALARWAFLHGIPEFLVRRAIARRGTKGDHALEDALKSLEAEVQQRIERGVENALARKQGAA